MITDKCTEQVFGKRKHQGSEMLDVRSWPLFALNRGGEIDDGRL